MDEAHSLELDLREDRRAKSQDAAFRDRKRSTFLHRLAVLEIAFAQPGAREQKGTAKEKWTLCWTPECEIRLALGSLLADSIEACAAFRLAEKLAAARDVGESTEVLLQAANCELADALTVALRRVQDVAVDDGAFPSIAKGMENIAELIRYGNVREVDPAPLRPILAQLYLRATLLLYGACVCDDDGAKVVRDAMDRVHEVAFLGEDDAPSRALDRRRAPRSPRSDDRNAFLSGYATAFLVERGPSPTPTLDREVSRRLSPGTDANVGVDWFEGLVQRNRAALFMRKPLWACLPGTSMSSTTTPSPRAALPAPRVLDVRPGEIRRVVSGSSAMCGRVSAHPSSRTRSRRRSTTRRSPICRAISPIGPRRASTSSRARPDDRLERFRLILGKTAEEGLRAQCGGNGSILGGADRGDRRARSADLRDRRGEARGEGRALRWPRPVRAPARQVARRHPRPTSQTTSSPSSSRTPSSGRASRSSSSSPRRSARSSPASSSSARSCRSRG